MDTINEDKIKTYISTFVFVSSFFYFWRNSLKATRDSVEDAFKPFPSREIILPSDNANVGDDASESEEDEEEDDDNAEDIKTKAIKLKKEKTIYNIAPLSYVSFMVIIKTFALSLIIISLLFAISVFIIGPMFITKDKISFQTKKSDLQPDFPEAAVGGKFADKISGSVKALKDKIPKSISSAFKPQKKPPVDIESLPNIYRANKNLVENGEPVHTSFFFLLYIFLEVSYVAVACVICVLVSYLYIRFGINQDLLNRKEYVMSQVNVIYTTNLVLFLLVFMSLKLYN